jgi:hypothetical protein
MKKITILLGILMAFCATEATEYVKKGSSITLSAGECCSNWSKSGSCISINPNDTSCTVSGNSTGTATVTVKDSRDGSTCTTYNITVYEAKINNVTSACDGASRSVTVSITPSSVPVSNISLRMTKSDGSTAYNNPAGAGSTITGNNKNWTISNARWFQGSNECDSSATYKISGTYYMSGNSEEFESVNFTVNAGGDCINGSAWLVSWFSGFPAYAVDELDYGDSIMYRATITGSGSFTRAMSAAVSYAPTLSSSQYYSMVVAEENYHKSQLEGSVSSPISATLHYRPENVMNALAGQNFEASDGSIATAMLQNAFNYQISQEASRSDELVFSFSGLRCQIEAQAKSAIQARFLSRLKCAYPMCN